jgi:hypothetical protein
MKKKIKNILDHIKYLFLIAFTIGIFSDIFLFKTTSLDLLTLFVFISWLLIIWLFEFSAKISFYLSLAFLAIILIFLTFKVAFIPNKVSVWLYLFLFWAAAQQLVELMKDSKE